MKNHNYHFTNLPQIDTITVNGREIPIFCARPYSREFLQDWADRVTGKPRQSAAEFIRSQQTKQPQENKSETEHAGS